MGVGKFYLLSKKFIYGDGGFKRVVYMSSHLKDIMAEDFKTVCAREGDPGLLDRIADESRTVTPPEAGAPPEPPEPVAPCFWSTIEPVTVPVAPVLCGVQVMELAETQYEYFVKYGSARSPTLVTTLPEIE